MIQFLKDWGALIIAGLSLLVAIISLIKSSKAQKLQTKINELEVKIKQYELDKITKEQEIKNKTLVEANVLHVSKNNYHIKICNLSEKPVYNVKAFIDNQYSILIINDDVMPFEILEPKKSFELSLVIHAMSARKFEVVTEWQDESGNKFENKQIRSL